MISNIFDIQSNVQYRFSHHVFFKKLVEPTNYTIKVILIKYDTLSSLRIVLAKNNEVHLKATIQQTDFLSFSLLLLLFMIDFEFIDYNNF